MVKEGVIIANIDLNFDDNGKLSNNYNIRGSVRNAKLRLLNKKNISDEIQPSSSLDLLILGRKAIDKFLDGVKYLTENSKVIILLDGDRRSIYAGMVQRDMKKPANILFEELKTLSKDIPKVNVVDLHSFFQEDWLYNNKNK